MNTLEKVLGHIDTSPRTTRRILRLVTILTYVFLYAPVVIVILLSFSERRVPSFPMKGFTFRWYEVFLSDERAVNALLTSVKIGVLSAIGSGIIGTLASIAIVRGNFNSRWLKSNFLHTLFLAPIVFPWIVTGIAVLTFYNLVGIDGTFYSLVLGHILITLPFVVLVVSSQLFRFDRTLEEAAKNLGSGNIRTFYEITLPIISPGIIAGMLFAFTISFDNFTQTFFWVGGDVTTVPILIYSKIRFGLDPTVNAIGTIIVMFSLTIATAAEIISNRVINSGKE